MGSTSPKAELIIRDLSAPEAASFHVFIELDRTIHDLKKILNLSLPRKPEVESQELVLEGAIVRDSTIISEVFGKAKVQPPTLLLVHRNSNQTSSSGAGPAQGLEPSQNSQGQPVAPPFIFGHGNPNAFQPLGFSFPILYAPLPFPGGAYRRQGSGNVPQGQTETQPRRPPFQPPPFPVQIPPMPAPFAGFPPPPPPPPPPHSGPRPPPPTRTIPVAEAGREVPQPIPIHRMPPPILVALPFPVAFPPGMYPPMPLHYGMHRPPGPGQNPPGQMQGRRRAVPAGGPPIRIHIRLDLMLILKLLVVIMVLNQEGSVSRFCLLSAVAVLIYLYQTGVLAPLARWFSARINRAVEGTPPANNPQAAPANQPQNAEQAGEAAGAEERQEGWQVLRNVRVFVVGLVTSLLPGFQVVQNGAAAQGAGPAAAVDADGGRPHED